MTKEQMDYIVRECKINQYENKIEIVNALASEIARLRTESGYTQDDTAYMLGVSPSTYRRIEAGQTEKIDASFILKASALFHTPIMMLFGYGHTLMKLYQKLYGASDRTKRLVKSILDMDEKSKENLSDYDPDDQIVMIEFAERICDGICVRRFLHKIANISEYKNKNWYFEADALVLINSNNYHPLYHMGDRLVISNRPPRNGEIGIFIKNDEFFIRRVVESPEEVYLERVDLSCDNDPIPIIVKRKNKEDMRTYTKFGTVTAVI